MDSLAKYLKREYQQLRVMIGSGMGKLTNLQALLKKDPAGKKYDYRLSAVDGVFQHCTKDGYKSERERTISIANFKRFEAEAGLDFKYAIKKEFLTATGISPELREFAEAYFTFAKNENEQDIATPKPQFTQEVIYLDIFINQIYEYKNTDLNNGTMVPDNQFSTVFNIDAGDCRTVIDSKIDKSHKSYLSGKGVGYKILLAACKHLKDIGFKWIALYASGPQTLVDMYKKYGFHHELKNVLLMDDVNEYDRIYLNGPGTIGAYLLGKIETVITEMSKISQDLIKVDFA